MSDDQQWLEGKWLLQERDALRAEVERLKDHLAGYKNPDLEHLLRAQRDEWAREAIAGLAKERDEARAYVKRLASHWNAPVEFDEARREAQQWLYETEVKPGQCPSCGRERKEDAMTITLGLQRVVEQLRRDAPHWEHDHDDEEDECRACSYEALLRDAERCLNAGQEG